MTISEDENDLSSITDAKNHVTSKSKSTHPNREPDVEVRPRRQLDHLCGSPSSAKPKERAEPSEHADEFGYGMTSR